MNFTDILLGIIALLSLLLFGASKDKKASKAEAKAKKAEAEARKAKAQSMIDKGSVEAIPQVVKREKTIEASKQAELERLKEVKSDGKEKQTAADKEAEEQKIFDMAAEQVARTRSRAADLSGSDRL